MSDELITIPLEWRFTQEELETIVDAALTSGSTYWIGRIESPPGISITAKSLFALWYGKAAEFTVTPNEWDTDDCRDGLRTLSLDVLKKGLVTMHCESTRHFADLVEGNWDDSTVDLLLQYSLFGEIIFG